MVQTGPCEITVVNVQGQAVPETLLSDGNWYFHASPGAVFKVKVALSPVNVTNAYGISQDCLVEMSLDGANLGYAHIFGRQEGSISAAFEGFIKDNKL